MAEGDSWDAETFEPDEPTVKPVVLDKWEGEDDDDDVKDNWDDEEEELGDEEKKTETKQSEKNKLNEKTKEKQPPQRKKQEQLREEVEESQESTDLTPEEDLAEKPQEEEEEADLKTTDEALVVSNNITGIDAISPTSRDDFTEFEKLLKDKISPYEKSIHYSGFLESLFRDLCLSLEVEDLKKINTSITVLLSEKQKQEKQQNKGKKKKKGTATGGLKAKMKDDLADYGEFDGGYAQDYEDFM